MEHKTSGKSKRKNVSAKESNDTISTNCNENKTDNKENLANDLPGGKNKKKKEDGKEVAAEPSSSRPKRCHKPVSYRSSLSPSPPAKRRPRTTTKRSNIEGANSSDEFNHSLDDLFGDSSEDSTVLVVDSSDTDRETSVQPLGSGCLDIALDKLNLDIRIDPNVRDRYFDSGFTADEATPESPETMRQRIDTIARQCRLHPANKKYNQGTVNNPPPITPGRWVGFTPAGQRHEFDLNALRPSSFNSEYEMLQWDTATIVNAKKMFQELKLGLFLPVGLDPNVERKYLATEEIAKKQATELFEQLAHASSPSRVSQLPIDKSVAFGTNEESDDKIKLLATEVELLELNKFASVSFDLEKEEPKLPKLLEEEVKSKLEKALHLNLTPLMILKDPTIVDTLENLADYCSAKEVVTSANLLLKKIKGLFQIPDNRDFKEFLAEENEKLKEKIKEMTPFEILLLTEKPEDTPCDYETDDEKSEVDSVHPEDLSEKEDNWVAIENGELWVDKSDPNHASQVSSGYETLTSLSVVDENGDSEISSSESDDSTSSYYLWLEEVGDDLQRMEEEGKLIEE